MAARRCLVLLLCILFLSLIAVSVSQETTIPVGQYASASVGPQTVTETAKQKAERQWEETEVGNTAATEKLDSLSDDIVLPSSAPKPKDDFQEELVIRPLHSGDIYASFQFRTLWKTDFSENKGKLTVSFHFRASNFKLYGLASETY